MNFIIFKLYKYFVRYKKKKKKIFLVKDDKIIDITFT